MGLKRYIKKASKYMGHNALGDAGQVLNPSGALIANLQTGEKPRNWRNSLDPQNWILKPEPELPPEPGAPPPAPTIDDAQIAASRSDRLRRRRGMLANIYAGSSASSTPSVAVKTLLGQ